MKVCFIGRDALCRQIFDPVIESLKETSIEVSRVSTIPGKHIYDVTKIPYKDTKLFVFNNDYIRQNRSIIRKSKKFGIKSLVFQHGVHSPYQGYLPLRADYFACYGQYTKDFFVSNGTPENRVMIVGSPKTDAIIEAQMKNVMNIRKKVYPKYNIPLDKKLAVLATQPYTGYHRATSDAEVHFLVEQVALAFEKFPEYHLLIRLHPAQTRKKFQDIIQKNVSFQVASMKCETYDVIRASDLILYTQSTFGLEALVFSKPTIQINFTDVPDYVPLGEWGASVKVSKSSELEPAIKEMTNPNSTTFRSCMSKVPEAVEKYLCKIDGKSSERAAQLIVDILNGKY